ncbi:MAG: hypothetical protein IPG53_17755 [Ignavibacteriales bacterium]|nr:hypothetical protein [Ignavibacteriales bacterium]
MGRCPTNDEFGPGWGHLWVDCPTNKDFGPGWGQVWVEKTEIINAKP